MGAGTGQTMARITTAWRRAEVVVEAIFFNSKKSQVDEGRKKNRRRRHSGTLHCGPVYNLGSVWLEPLLEVRA